MSKHTPGPWTITTGAEGNTLVTSPHDKDGIDDDVCLVYGGNDKDPETMGANARLIAAAPELLAALKRTLSNAIGHACDARGDDCNFEDWPWVQQAREAINNATKEEA